MDKYKDIKICKERGIAKKMILSTFFLYFGTTYFFFLLLQKKIKQMKKKKKKVARLECRADKDRTALRGTGG